MDDMSAPEPITRVKLSLKHDDRASMQLINALGDVLADVHDGVPSVGILGGDYTDLVIDNASGKIIGWTPITMEEYDAWEGE